MCVRRLHLLSKQQTEKRKEKLNTKCWLIAEQPLRGLTARGSLRYSSLTTAAQQAGRRSRQRTSRERGQTERPSGRGRVDHAGLPELPVTQRAQRLLPNIIISKDRLLCLLLFNAGEQILRLLVPPLSCSFLLHLATSLRSNHMSFVLNS